MNRFASSPWLLLLAIPFGLYFATMLRTIGLPDAPILLDAMSVPVLSGHANNHNLNNLVGFVFQRLPAGDLVFRSNLTAVVYGTVTLGLFCALLRTLGAARAPALFATGALMVSHAFWWHSTQAESYGLSALLLCAILLLVARDEAERAAGRERPWRLPLAACLAGLALFNHLQNGALAPGLAAVALASRRRFAANRCRLLRRYAGAYFLGALPYLAVVAVDFARTTDSASTSAWMTGGGFRDLMFRFRSWEPVADFAHWVLLQFPSPFLLLIVLGLALALHACSLIPPRRRDGPLTAAGFTAARGVLACAATVFVVNTLFFMGYKTWDQFAFYLPSFLCLALAGGLGAAWLIGVSRGPWLTRHLILLVLCVGLPPVIYVNIPRQAAEGDGYWHRRFGAAHAAYRDRYDLVGMYADPIFHDRGTIEAFARSLLERLPANAWLVDDVSIYYQLEFLRAREALRPDLRLELIRPLNMAGWGTATDDIVSMGLLATNRLFIVATNGPCAPVVAAFAARGRRPVAFDLPGGRRIHELRPETAD